MLHGCKVLKRHRRHSNHIYDNDLHVMFERNYIKRIASILLHMHVFLLSLSMLMSYRTCNARCTSTYPVGSWKAKSNSWCPSLKTTSRVSLSSVKRNERKMKKRFEQPSVFAQNRIAYTFTRVYNRYVISKYCKTIYLTESVRNLTLAHFSCRKC